MKTPNMFRLVSHKYHVRRVYKITNHRCELSGHEWREYGDLIRFEVSGPYGATDVKRFKPNMKGAIKAIKYAREMDAFFVKYPMKLSMSQRDFDKAVALGLDLTGYCSEVN